MRGRKRARKRRDLPPGQLDGAAGNGQLEGFEEELSRAEAALASALGRDDLGEVEGAKLRARHAAKVQHLRSIVLGVRGEHEDAVAAARQAAAAEDLLIKASKADLVTRVEELERRVQEARTGGASVRELARKRRAGAQPPGADPRS